MFLFKLEIGSFYMRVKLIHFCRNKDIVDNGGYNEKNQVISKLFRQLQYHDAARDRDYLKDQIVNGNDILLLICGQKRALVSKEICRYGVQKEKKVYQSYIAVRV